MQALLLWACNKSFGGKVGTLTKSKEAPSKPLKSSYSSCHFPVHMILHHWGTISMCPSKDPSFWLSFPFPYMPMPSPHSFQAASRKAPGAMRQPPRPHAGGRAGGSGLLRTKWKSLHYSRVYIGVIVENEEIKFLYNPYLIHLRTFTYI